MLFKTNKPYVKRYGKNGELLNPINGAYLHNGPNRQLKRSKKWKKYYPLLLSGKITMELFKAKVGFSIKES